MISIRNMRKALHMSQAELAKMLNVHQTAVSQWETGKTFPDIGTLQKIAEYFGVSVDAIIGNSPNETILFNEDGSFSVSSKSSKPIYLKINKGEKKPEVEFDDFTYSMYKEAQGLTEEDKQQLLRMARFFREQQDQKEK